MPLSPFTTTITSDYESFLATVMRQRRPKRVHHIELMLDAEIRSALVDRFDLARGLNRSQPDFELRQEVTLQRFLGYDYVCARPEKMDWVFNRDVVGDTADLARDQGRSYVNEQRGPITNWEDFEKYPWPDPQKFTTVALEWYEKNLPDDMCVLGRGVGHYAEYISWLMGYETLCYALYDQRDLVKAIYERFRKIDLEVVKLELQFSRVKVLWASDDMGHRSGTLISPADLREFAIPGHRETTRLTHQAGRLYFLHACGQLAEIMEDLIADVKIDAKHSFEDVITPVAEMYKTYGSRIGILGGLDVDLVCRADEAAIRQRVRDTLDQCGRGFGYCLGTGNSVANYVPVDHYLAMLDEGRKYASR